MTNPPNDMSKMVKSTMKGTANTLLHLLDLEARKLKFGLVWLKLLYGSSGGRAVSAKYKLYELELSSKKFLQHIQQTV